MSLDKFVAPALGIAAVAMVGLCVLALNPWLELWHHRRSGARNVRDLELGKLDFRNRFDLSQKTPPITTMTRDEDDLEPTPQERKSRR
ncbi:hypothetical protein diail_2887 [Diaporthe ilicicola]|nr:hypothetical protein diail_2887 [Diaporthe ilicicola]